MLRLVSYKVDFHAPLFIPLSIFIILIAALFEPQQPITSSSDRIAADQLPIDWAGQHGLQVGIRFRLVGLGGHSGEKPPAFGSSIAPSSHSVKCLRAVAEAAYEAHL